MSFGQSTFEALDFFFNYNGITLINKVVGINYGALFVSDFGTDGSKPDIAVVDIELKKHEGCQSGKFLWSRVYSNGSTHHELYCANCCHNANKSLVRIAVIPAEISLERLSKFIMPIGKHAGEPLANIPRDYLSWVATDFKQVNVRRKAFAYLEMTKTST